jgi:ABC-type multidrug transport system fused ATPase/permease subunit
MTKSFLKIIPLIRPHAALLIIAGVTAVIMSMIEQLVPIAVGKVVNAAFTQHIPSGPVITPSALLIGSQLLRIAQRLGTEWPTTRIGAALFQHGVFHLLSNSMCWFTASHSGALQVRLERSSRAVSQLLRMLLSDILAPLVGLVIAGYFICRAEIAVGLVTVIVVPLLSLLTVLQARSQTGIRIAINHAREEQGIRVVEAVDGIEQVKLFRAERDEAERAGDVARTLAAKEYRHHRAMAAFDLAKLLVERGGFGAVVILSLIAARRHGSDLGPGGVLMLILLFEKATEPVRHLHRIIDEASEQWILTRDYLQLLASAPIRRDMLIRDGAGREVAFDHVVFSYNGAERPVINDVTLRIPQGARVALVGRSGSGKSTLGKLLMGLYQPNSGKILIDGKPVLPIE